MLRKCKGTESTYQVGRCNFLDNILRMSLGVDGTVVGDCVHLLALGSDFGDRVRLGFLELVNDGVHDIHENDLFS